MVFLVLRVGNRLKAYPVDMDQRKQVGALMKTDRSISIFCNNYPF